MRAFGMRSVGIFIVTFALLSPAWAFVGGIAAFVAAICLCLIYMFVLDDFTQWFEHRQAKWTLTPNELIYENPHDDIEAHALPLSDIVTARPRFLWNIQLRLSNGMAVTMHYIDGPKGISKIIETAIASEATS